MKPTVPAEKYRVREAGTVILSSSASRNSTDGRTTQHNATSFRVVPKLLIRGVPEGIGNGLQNRLRGFESRHHVHRASRCFSSGGGL